jgi:hypothetical protein
MPLDRSAYPTLNAPSTDCGGAALTPAMLDNFRDWILSDEYRERQRQAQEEQFRQMDALNLQLKTSFAKSLGKTVEQLTKKDMEKLNEQCFQGWLKYKGVTEQEFWDWMG